MPENSQRIESLPIIEGRRPCGHAPAGRGSSRGGTGLPRARRTHAHHTDTVTDSSHTPLLYLRKRNRMPFKPCPHVHASRTNNEPNENQHSIVATVQHDTSVSPGECSPRAIGPYPAHTNAPRP